MEKIRVAVRDFSETPAGRYRKDSPRSGEQFREEKLIPALEQAQKIEADVEVDLDGTLGFGSSFLEEAFGGLVRKGFKGKELHSRLGIKTSVPIYLERVWSYIDEEDVRTNGRG